MLKLVAEKGINFHTDDAGWRNANTSFWDPSDIQRSLDLLIYLLRSWHCNSYGSPWSFVLNNWNRRGTKYWCIVLSRCIFQNGNRTTRVICACIIFGRRIQSKERAWFLKLILNLFWCLRRSSWTNFWEISAFRLFHGDFLVLSGWRSGSDVAIRTMSVYGYGF